MGRPQFTRCLVALVASALVASTSAVKAPTTTQTSTWASTLSSSLLGLNNQASSHAELEQAFQTFHYPETTVNGADIFATMRDSLNAKVAHRNSALMAIHADATHRYNTSVMGVDHSTECCRLTEAQQSYSSFYFRDILKNNSCIRYNVGANAATVTAKQDAGRTFNMDDTTFRALHQDSPTLKWTYFGTDQGFFRIYPGPWRSTCDTYDPRFRPWYVAAATPDPKDIVIIVDSSGSMRKEARMSLASEAAKVVLSTLNPNDFVGVVDFDSEAQVPEGCFQTELAQATPYNVAQLSQFVDDMEAQGQTSYVKALTKAFDLLDNAKSSESGSGGLQTIIFLTDGIPNESDSEILNMLTSKRSGRTAANQVHLLTFLLGTADATALLNTMAIQNGGQFTHVSDGGDLRTAMGSYYDFFSTPNPNQPIIYSPPYFDASGLGLITTASLPVYQGTTLKGVAGVDLTIADLVSDAALFGEGESLSYAFIIDKYGRALVHPLLPLPDNLATDPIITDIALLEPVSGFTTVRSRMMGRQSGSAVLNVKRSVARGSANTEGVVEVSFTATYYYGPIDNSPFSLCLVMADPDLKEHKLASLAKPTDMDSLTYHRIDLLGSTNTQKAKCAQFKSPSNKEFSTVKLAPAAFKDPVYYQEQEESTAHAEAMNRFFRSDLGDVSDLPAQLKLTNPDAIKKDVWATAAADAAYVANADAVMQHTAWRYVATHTGIFRSYPGHPTANNYDPRIRPWFLRSMAHPDLVAISTPYFDADGSGTIVTMSTAVRTTDSANVKTVRAVTGVDFTLGELQKLVSQTGDCFHEDYECSIVDSSGLVVLNDQQMRESDSGLFIGDSYPVVAKALADAGLLTTSSCNHFQAKQANRFYLLDLGGAGGQLGMAGDSLGCPAEAGFSISAIAGTNSFLLVTSRDCCVKWEAALNPAAAGAPSLSPVALDFDTCDTQFSLTASQAAAPTCPPDVAPGGATYKPPEVSTVFAKCWPSECTSVRSVTQCLERIGCTVCYQGADDDAGFTCKPSTTGCGSGSTSTGALPEKCRNMAAPDNGVDNAATPLAPGLLAACVAVVAILASFL